MKKITRRKFVWTALAGAAGAIAVPQALKLAARHGLLPPPDGQGLLTVGEMLNYTAHRALIAGGSMAREFKSSDISNVSRVNHQHPFFDPYDGLALRDFVDWRLYVDGLVGRPLALSLSDLHSLPATTQITQLVCEEGWSFIAAWTGVQLSALLKLANASENARYVVFHPFDDFWGSIDIHEAHHPQTLLAYAMNGDKLSLDHGAPLRLRVPRQLGYKNLKFLSRISVVDSLKNIGEGRGSASPDIGYAWYAGI
jgi:DMSO/TMAO reductase YedYZ molybdopterin-dependent catalytic subunit